MKTDLHYHKYLFLTTVAGRAEWVEVVACDYESACADFDQAEFEDRPAREIPCRFFS